MSADPHTAFTDVRAAIRAHMSREFPFAVELSLRPLIDYWQGLVSQGGTFAQLGTDLLERVQKAPGLADPITDFAVIERHRGLVRNLMSAVFSPASSDQEYAAALVPYQFRPIYTSARFER